MHLLFHHLKKDLRHLRTILIVWFLLLGVQVVAYSAPLPAAPGGIGLSILSAFLMLAPVWLTLFVVLAVALLIQDDRPSGGSAFWLTRPIPAGAVLVSKGLFLLIFFVLAPLIVELAVFRGHGIDSRDTLLAGAEILLRQLALVCAAAGLSAVTANFLRYATWGLVIVAGYAVILFAFRVAGAPLEEGSALFHSSGTSSLGASRTLPAGLLAVVFGLTVAANQYLTRRTARSVALACLGGVLSFGAGHFWTVDFFGTDGFLAPPHDRGEPRATVTVEGEALFLPEAVRDGNYEILATLPLESGARYRDGSETFSVLDLERGLARFTVHVRLRRTNLLFTPRVTALRDPETFYLLVNRETRETVRAEAPAASYFDHVPDTRRFRREDARLQFASEPMTPSRETPDIDTPWLADATLVIVRPVD